MWDEAKGNGLENLHAVLAPVRRDLGMGSLLNTDCAQMILVGAQLQNTYARFWYLLTGDFACELIEKLVSVVSLLWSRGRGWDQQNVRAGVLRLIFSFL